MARDWEATFGSWGAPPGQTESEKCDNAANAIRKAIRESEKLTGRKIDVFAQGSYRNRTNVRGDSDVDVCICCRDSIFFDLPSNVTTSDVGISAPAAYPFAEFKKDVRDALIDYFGASAVTPGKKAFDIHENTYRLDADAVPTFEYRWYNSPTSYTEGTAFTPDNGSRIVNWPQQNYDNGVAKNDQTNRRFKSVVRILKRLRNEMADANVAAAKPIASYLIECLVWNVPNEGFGHSSLTADVRYALAHLFNETRTDESCREWGEVNELKYLFHPVQSWTRQGVNTFLDKVWDYIGFRS